MNVSANSQRNYACISQRDTNHNLEKKMISSVKFLKFQKTSYTGLKYEKSIHCYVTFEKLAQIILNSNELPSILITFVRTINVYYQPNHQAQNIARSILPHN